MQRNQKKKRVADYRENYSTRWLAHVGSCIPSFTCTAKAVAQIKSRTRLLSATMVITIESAASGNCTCLWRSRFTLVKSGWPLKAEASDRPLPPRFAFINKTRPISPLFSFNPIFFFFNLYIFLLFFFFLKFISNSKNQYQFWFNFISE